MKDYIKKVLAFCKLLDYDGGVSLTNIAFIAIIVKVIMAPQIDSQTVIALVTLCVNYMHKRSTNNDQNGPNSQKDGARA